MLSTSRWKHATQQNCSPQPRPGPKRKEKGGARSPPHPSRPSPRDLQASPQHNLPKALPAPSRVTLGSKPVSQGPSGGLQVCRTAEPAPNPASTWASPRRQMSRSVWKPPAKAVPEPRCAHTLCARNFTLQGMVRDGHRVTRIHCGIVSYAEKSETISLPNCQG